MKCLFGHNWYLGDYALGNARSKYTGDLISRTERRCMDCDARQISRGQYSKEHQGVLPGSRKWIPYTPGDEVDSITYIWLTENVLA